MRVLAIDTALAACAAAVLDTNHGIVASEPIPIGLDQRGAINVNSPRTFAPVGTFAPDALLIVAG